MSTRREAREVAMQALYAFELGGGEASHILETVVKERLGDDREGIEFATRLFLRTVDRLEESDRLIERHTENWDLSRIALIDRIVLRMAICEFRGFEDIPPKVTINEAIEVVKKYSTERSGQFVNGILDAILAELKSAGELKKKGRGLVGMDNSGESSPGE